jgi:hypothetical protein
MGEKIMEQQTTKKPAGRLRSPNYPNYDLKECVGFAAKLFKKYGTTEVHTEDAVTQMGHSYTSSTAGRVLASMFSFGLLESRGTKDSKFVSLSKLARQILMEDEGTPERIALLQQAALKDDSMQAIWKKWGANKLPHVDSIKKSLMFEMKYAPEGAKRFASVIIDTYEYAHLKDASPEETQTEDETEEVVEIQEPQRGDKYTRVTESKKSMRVTNLLLRGTDREIILQSPEDLTEDEFKKVFEWLEFSRDGLVNPVESAVKNNGKHEEKPKEKEST